MKTVSGRDNVTGLVTVKNAFGPVWEYFGVCRNDKGEPANKDEAVCTSSPFSSLMCRYLCNQVLQQEPVEEGHLVPIYSLFYRP